MQIVKTAVETEAMHRSLHRAVVPQPAHCIVNVQTVGDHRPTVTKRSKVLLDDKARTYSIAQLTLAESVSMTIDPLRVIFYHPQLVLLCDSADRFHIRALAVEMHGNNTDCPRSDRRTDFLRIDVVSLVDRIHKHDLSTSYPDGFCGGKESIRRGDDFVAGLQPQRHERQPQCVGARVHANCMLQPEILGQLPLKAFTRRACDVSPTLEDSLNCSVNFALNAVILAPMSIKRHGYPRSRHVHYC